MSTIVTPADPAAESVGLVRGLGRLEATAVVISTIIGTGIFLVAGPMARAAGSAGLVLITWAAGTVIAICGTLCFAELGAALPLAGVFESDHSPTPRKAHGNQAHTEQGEGSRLRY